MGFLIDAQGRSHELLFRSNVVSTGLFTDIKLNGDGEAARAVVLRVRSAGNTEFVVFPRRGKVEINGEEVRQHTMDADPSKR